MGDEEKKEKKKKSKKKAETEAPSAEEPPVAAVPVEEPPQPPPEATVAPAEPPPPEKKPASKRKAQRCGSNVFAMFTQRKVQEFKEAFQLIDQDKDGFITKSDLKLTFDLLVTPYSISGREVDDDDLEAMLAEAPGPLNFTMFLTIFGERISGTDEEDVIMSAFSIFDEGDGKMKEEVLKSTLRKRGDKFTDEEADTCLKEAPVDKEGYISIRRFTRILTKGDEDDDTDGG